MNMKYIAKISLLNLISNFMLKSMTLIIGIFVARVYGSEAFAIYGLIHSIVAMLGNSPAQGFLIANSKIIAEKNNNESRDLHSSLIIMLAYICVLIILNLAGGVNHIFLGESRLYWNYGLHLTISVILYYWCQGVLGGDLKYDVIAKSSTFIIILGSILAVICSKFIGLKGVFLGVGSAYNIVAFYLIYRIFESKNIILEFSNDGKANSMMRVSAIVIPLILVNLMVSPINWYVNTLILTNTWGGIESLAIYLVAFQWASLLSQISNSIGGVFVPLMVKKYNNNFDIGRINQYAAWIFVVIFVIPLMAVAEVVHYLYSFKYNLNEFKMVFYLMLIATVVSTFKGGVGRVISISKWSWLSIISNAIWALIFVMLTKSFLEYSIVGVASAYLISHVIHSVISLPIYSRLRLFNMNDILNFNVLSIFVITTMAAMTQYYTVDMSYRIILVFLCMILNITFFYRIFKNEKG